YRHRIRNQPNRHRIGTNRAKLRLLVLSSIPEQLKLPRIAGRLCEPEVAEGMRGEQATARRALDEALLDEERLDDVLDGVARLRQRGGQRLPADRPAAIVERDGREIAAVHAVETGGINLELDQRTVGSLAVDGGGAAHMGEVADAAQQPSGDARGAARAPGNLVAALRRDVDAEHAGAPADDQLQFL